MDESLIPEITEFVKKFEHGSYQNQTEKYVDFLWRENAQFRQIMQGREATIVRLLRENADLRQQVRGFETKLNARKK